MWDKKAKIILLQAKIIDLSKEIDYLKNSMQEVERKINQKLNNLPTESSQLIKLAGGPEITVETLVKKVASNLLPLIKQHISEELSQIDMQEVSDKVTEKLDTSSIEKNLTESESLIKGILAKIDEDSFCDKIVGEIDTSSIEKNLADSEPLREKVIESLDKENLCDKIVENINEDSLYEKLADTLKEKLTSEDFISKLTGPLADKILECQNLDFDDIAEKIAEKISGNTMKEKLDDKDFIAQLVEALKDQILADENLDFDDIAEKVSEKISEKLTVNLKSE